MHAQGTPYTDPGAAAQSATGETLDILTQGAVDVFTEGPYRITYQATDSQGRTTIELERQVIVVGSNFNYLDYAIIGDEVIITDCDPAVAGELLIPDLIEGLPVVAISGGAFQDCQNLTGIILPASIQSIGARAFYNCSKLLSADLPDSLTTIAESTFSGCRALLDISLPANLRTIESSAFQNCENLNALILPEGLTRIDYNAFHFCTSLLEVSFPSTLTTIRDNAFSYCFQLKSIELPDALQELASWAFGECYALETVRLPSNIQSIRHRTFYRCEALTTITLPATVNHIESWAFEGCSQLQEVVLEGDAPQIQEGIFAGLPGTARAYVNAGASGYGASLGGLPISLDPTISLIGPSLIKHRSGRAYQDPGATALDRQEGALEVTVRGVVGIHTLGDYTLSYHAQDSQGNQAEPVERIVQVVDGTLPFITLNGPEAIIHTIGTQYIDAGASALDQYDKPVEVTLSGEVNVFALGAYTLTYNAIDEQKQSAIPVERQVWVVDRNYQYLEYYVSEGGIIITDCDPAVAGELLIPD
ncbi:MAG: leucine-rich repeat protein, partial [Limisphaerales bacterium]